jgi:hypothetical protein
MDSIYNDTKSNGAYLYSWNNAEKKYKKTEQKYEIFSSFQKDPPDSTDKYKVISFTLNAENYINFLEESYKQSEDKSTLNLDIKNKILELTKQNNQFASKDKYPGMHSDVVAYNYAKQNGIEDPNITLLTISSGDELSPLPTCLNCKNIIPEQVRVASGRHLKVNELNR